MNLEKDGKNLIIILTELAVIFLMVFNVLPREASLFLTGLMIFYFIFSPLEDSLWVFIASIPLFVALPITENFDTMANWRILLAVLFVVLFFKSGISINLIRNNIKHHQWEYLVGIFLLIGCFSLLKADNVWIGVKKLLFIINIFLLYIIIRNLVVKNKEITFKIIGAIKVAIGLTLGIGFVQFIAVFFVRLFPFWQFWARRVIDVFYGQDLSNLLSYSNTWFSYYASLPATLRMFSVFPDSHSFAFFCILALPFFLTLIFLQRKGESDSLFGSRILKYLLLIVCLLAIIFSGSRGAWVSALGALLIFLFILFLYWSPTMRSWTNFFTPHLSRIDTERQKNKKSLKGAGFIPKSSENWRKQIGLILGCLIIFFLLFPISSRILLFSQQVQLERPLSLEGLSLFERARSIIDFDEISVRSRLEIWQRTVDSIIIHPFLGVGIGNYPTVLNEKMSSAKKGSSAHCLYLDIASEMGVFALLILLVIFWQILKRAWFIFQGKTKEDNLYLQTWAGFFVLALVWILGYSLFDVVLFNDKVFLFFVANLGLLYATNSSLSFR